MLLTYKLDELTEDVLLSPEDAQVLKARGEYSTIRDFGDWITDLANQEV